MSAALSASIAVFTWMLATMSWAGIVSVWSRPRHQAHKREGWRWYWLAVLLVAIFPLLLAPVLALVPFPILAIELDAVATIGDLRQSLPNWRIAPAGSLLLQIGAVLCLILYGVGLARHLASLIASLRRTRRLIRGANTMPSDQVAQLELAGVTLLVTPENVSPFCVGGVRPAIVLPSPVLPQMSRTQVQLIIGHELEHLRRGDPWLFLGLELLDVLFWFNPFVLGLTSRLRLAAEIVCDAAVLQRSGAHRRTYADALLRTLDATRGNRPGITAFGQRGDAPRIRLVHILGSVDSRQHTVLASSLVVAAAIAVSMSGASLGASTARIAVLGDAGMVWALDRRVTQLYGASGDSSRCRPALGSGLKKAASYKEGD